MPCLAIAFALGFPRLTLVALWLLSDWFDAAYDGLLFPVLGLLFAPLSVIWYAIVLTYFGGAWTGGAIAGMAIAVGLDFGLIGGSARGRGE